MTAVSVKNINEAADNGIIAAKNKKLSWCWQLARRV